MGLLELGLKSKIHLGLGAMAMFFLIGMGPVWGIEVDLTLDQAAHLLSAGRGPMEKANTVEDVTKLIKAADKANRIGTDPEQEPCSSSAVLKTKSYWLEYFGRREAAESKRLKTDIRMPDAKVKEILQMPNLEIEIGLCGQEEYFAEGADVALQQNSNNIMPVDKGKPSRCRKIPGSKMDYVSRFSARFAYQDFDPMAPANIVVFFPDGKLISLEVDFSKVK